MSVVSRAMQMPSLRAWLETVTRSWHGLNLLLDGTFIQVIPVASHARNNWIFQAIQTESREMPWEPPSIYDPALSPSTPTCLQQRAASFHAVLPGKIRARSRSKWKGGS